MTSFIRCLAVVRVTAEWSVVGDSDGLSYCRDRPFAQQALSGKAFTLVLPSIGHYPFILQTILASVFELCCKYPVKLYPDIQHFKGASRVVERAHTYAAAVRLCCDDLLSGSF